MIKINNEFRIEASANEIWEVISQVECYGDWNSFVSRCKSSLEPGASIKMKVHLFSFPISQKETVFENQKHSLLSYGVKLPILLSSKREHKIEALDDGTSLYQSTFRLDGLLAPLISLLLLTRLQSGFNRMSQELKAEVLRRQDTQEKKD